MKLRTPLLGAALLLTAACASGDLRRISFSSDLSPADLAHYQRKAGDSDERRIENFSSGLLLLPLLWRDREGDASRDAAGELQYHFEDDWGLLLWAVRLSATANFDERGRNVAWEQSRALALGAVRGSNGETRVDGKVVETRSFRLLWGLLEIEKTARGRSFRLLWIPF